MVIYAIPIMLFVRRKTARCPVADSQEPSDPSAHAQTGSRAAFYRIEQDNPGMIPAGGIIVSSPHGVAGGGKRRPGSLWRWLLDANPTRVSALHLSLKQG